MLKGIKYFLASVFCALVFSCAPTHALSVTSLERISPDSDQIEINEPSAGYSFDATFLDKNQTLSYNATITNETGGAAKIESINLTDSQHQFLEYSYSGLSIDDEIPSGESKTITITVKTNENNTQTVDEDYNLSINYRNLEPKPPRPPIPGPDNPSDDTDTNPNTSSAIVKTISIAAVSLGAAIFVFARNKKLRNFAFIFALPFAGLCLVSSATADETANLAILGKVHFVNTYSININPNGGAYEGSTGVKTLRIRDGQPCVLSNDPVRETYDFSGWSYNGTALQGNSFIVSEDADVVANWAEIYHTVTVNPNGGEYSGELSTQVRDGATFRIGANPTRDTYTFTGWETNPDSINPNADVVVRQDITFKALWNENYIDITINPNGGAYNGQTTTYTESYREGEEITMSDAERAHYRFTGWSMSEGSLDENNKFIVRKPVTLTANWEQIYHRLTIDPNGGVYDGHDSEFFTDYPEGNSVSILTPTRDTYRFTGWTITPNIAFTDSLTIDQDYKLVANWEEIYHTITVNPNGGNYDGELSMQVRDGATFHIGANPTRDTYTFTGWSVNPSSINPNTDIIVRQDISFTAQWNENYYDVTINPNGGNYDGHTSEYTDSYREGHEITMGDATRDHYTFAGWDKNGSDLQDPSFYVMENTTLTAKWDEIRHTVTIDPNGGEYDGPLTTEVHESDYFTLGNNPTRNHYRFTGWTASVGTISDNKIQVNSDITITANWEKLSYDVTIDPNGGEYDGHTNSYTESHQYETEITMGAPTRDHFRFTGWSMSTGSLDDNNKFIVSENVTLTAQWEEIKFNLTIKPNGGEYDGHTDEFSREYREGTVVNLATPTKEHSHFTHWTREDDSEYTASSITIDQDITLTANYETDVFHVIIDPNGGAYNNSSEIYEDDLEYGTTLPLASVTARENYVLAGWTKNSTSSLDRDTEEITITEDTTLKAIWHETRIVTVDPNGGIYDNSSEPSTYRVEINTAFTLDEATKENYVLDGWTVNNDHKLDGNSMTIVNDTTFRAEWFFPVARIERTQKLYPSIMAAHDDAQANDIITLLVDTSEIVRNEKKVTLDLNYHTVTGYLYNTAMGNIVLVNGEINNYNSPIHNEENPSAAAVVNAGKLTMGIDDYTGGETNQKAPLISSDNIRIVGSDYGIAQNGEFYFYDGFIEGVIGLAGGYNGSPWYRNTFDGVVVSYFPFVDRNTEKDCQHVELENSDKAVSKTIVGGEIYYYNLQDNINTSAITGYDMYAVRDFDASYPITVAENVEIIFDLDGYTVNFGENSTVDGNLTIRDSKTGDEAGILALAKPLTNNGTLTISNAKAKAVTVNDFMINNANLVMRNSTISSDKSVTVNVQQNGSSFDLDDDSYIRSSSSDKPAILNASTDLNITSGNIVSDGNIAIRNLNGATMTVSGGEVKIAESTTYYGCAIYGDADNNTLTMTGGKVSAHSANYYYATAICGMHANISGGEVSATAAGSGQATAINGSSRTINISGDTNLNATSASNTARIFSGNSQNVTISGDPEIYASSDSYGDAMVVEGDYGSTTINGGTLTVETAYGTAYITNDMEKAVTVNGGTLTAHSTNGDALALGRADRWAPSIYINGGKITAIADNPDKVGTGAAGYVVRMTDGDLYGSSYGISSVYVGNLTDNYIYGGKVEGGIHGIYNSTITLGKNDIVDDRSNIDITTPEIKGGVNAIYGGQIAFYDGILKGSTDASYINNTDVITAIPDGTHRHVEQVGGEEHCWLVEDEDYLEVNGQTFNSLTGAYAAVEDGGTINVIADANTAAVLPNNTKNITFNLGDHTITYMQPILNSGSITFVGDGYLVNASTSNATIGNSGTITIESGHIVSNKYSAIANTGNSTLTVNGGEISTLNMQPNYACTIGSDSSSSHFYMTGGKASASSTNQVNLTAICGMHSDISGGEVSATSAGDATAVSGYSRVITISNGAIITATSTGATARATGNNWQTLTISGDDTIVRATASGNGSAIISDGDYGTTTINSGTLIAEAVNGNAYITNDMEKTVTINGGNLTAHSTNGDALALGCADHWSPSIYINGGKISAIADNPDKVGTGAAGYVVRMTDGELYGSTYGINRIYNGDINNNYVYGGKVEGGKYGINSSSITIGQNDTIDGRSNISITAPEIKGGIYAINSTNINFYDGILKGGENYINDTQLVKAVPDGAHRHVEQVGDEEHCWLVEDEDYLEVNGQTFNSLTGAYAAVEDGGTINVIADASTPAVLPSNTKNITFNLGDHTLTYQQPLKNSGTMTIVGNGYLVNDNNDSVTIENSGVINIESGHIVSNRSRAYEGLDNSTLNISGGEIYTSDVRVNYICTIHSDYSNANLYMTGGKVYASTNEQRGISTICGVNSNISGGEVSATSPYDATAINGGSRTTNISNGALITATSTNGGTARVTGGNWQTLTISGDDTIVRATASGNGSAIISDGDYGATTINGGTLTTEAVNGNAYITNDMEKTITVNGGILTAHSTNGDALALGCADHWSPSVYINGGKITAIADNPDKVGTGAAGHSLQMVGGELYGSTYGIRNVYTNNTTIGVDDGIVNNGLDGTSDKPYIHGGRYGIYGSSFKFYDGIIEGGVAPHYDRNIKTIADHTNVFYGQNTIDDETFQTAYLVAEQDVARIGNGTDAPLYKSLDAAISDAQPGDTIYLIRDAYTYAILNIPAEKQFTLDLNGFNIVAANRIENNGDVTITNSSTDKPSTEFHDYDPFFINRSGAKLTIDNLNVKANRIAENDGGTLTFSNSALTSYTNANEYLLRNYSGTLNIDDSTIDVTNENHAIYLDNGNFNISDSQINAQRDIYAYRLTGDSTISNSTINATSDYNSYVTNINYGSGKVTISDNSKLTGSLYYDEINLDVKDTLIKKTTYRDEDIITLLHNTSILDNVTVEHTNSNFWNYGGYRSVLNNSGNATIKNSNFQQTTTDNAYNWPGKESRVITNSGTLAITDTNITQADINSTDFSSTALYNSGTLSLIGSNITTTRSLTSAYGLYNDGTATIDSSTITVTGKRAFGIYANSGELTLGEAEPELLPDGTHNPDYGKATANVSTTTPYISAIGTENGVAATINAGKLNFYDGKLYQSNPNGPALQPDGSPVALTKVEYLYQAEAYEDIYGNYYFILEFMRN